jgi:hypothetical protein
MRSVPLNAVAFSSPSMLAPTVECGGGGLVRFLSRRGEFGSVSPSSLEGPAFHNVFLRLVAQVGSTSSHT